MGNRTRPAFPPPADAATPGRRLRLRQGRHGVEAQVATLPGEILDPERMQAGPHGRHVHCAGLRVWVVEEGHADSPAVLLIHGLGVHGGIWSQTVPALVAQGFRVIVPDLPGHGRSDARRRASYSPRFHTRVLIALLDALQVHRFSVVGNSLGGLLAARLALALPDRVERLVLVDAAGLSHQGVPWKSRLAYLPAVLPTPPPPVWTRLFLSRMVVFDPRHVPGLVALTEAYLPSVTAFRRTATGLLGPEGSVASDLHRIETPTLLVWGERDPQIPVEQAHEALAALPNARLVRLAGTGHVPMWESPDAFRDALCDFLTQSHPPASDRPASEPNAIASSSDPAPREPETLCPKTQSSRAETNATSTLTLTRDDLASVSAPPAQSPPIPGPIRPVTPDARASDTSLSPHGIAKQGRAYRLNRPVPVRHLADRPGRVPAPPSDPLHAPPPASGPPRAPDRPQ